MPTNPLFTLVAADARGLNVRAVSVPGVRQLPSYVETHPAYQPVVESFMARVAQGSAFNGPTLPPVAVELSDQEIVWHCQLSTYAEGRGITAWATEQLGDGVVPALFPVINAPAAASGLDVCVITSDSQVLVTKRSAKVAKFPNCYMLGFGEGLEVEDLGQQNLFGAARRCLHEELGFVVPKTPEFDAMFKTVAVTRESDSYTWSAYVLLDLQGAEGKEYTAEAILERANAGKDAWELAALMAVPFDEVAFVLSAQEKVTPPTRMMLELLTEHLMIAQG